MKRMNRENLNFQRLIDGVIRRISDSPHLLSWYSNSGNLNKEKITKYFDIYKGKRCFIIANGPSIRKTDLEFLKDEITFGLNRIYLNFQHSNFRPKYYIAVNSLVLDQFFSEISQLKMPKFLNWDQRKHFRMGDQNMLFLKPRLVMNDYFEPDITKPFVFGGTVTFVALQLAFYMGFKEVILVGLDHKYEESGTPNKTERRESEKDFSHFHPDYFPKGIKWQLPDLLRSEIDYKLADFAYKRNNRQILDATIDGNCPVFTKVKYETLFPKSGNNTI